jgi:hypothetical protein
MERRVDRSAKVSALAPDAHAEASSGSTIPDGCLARISATRPALAAAAPTWRQRDPGGDGRGEARGSGGEAGGELRSRPLPVRSCVRTAENVKVSVLAPLLNGGVATVLYCFVWICFSAVAAITS